MHLRIVIVICLSFSPTILARVMQKRKAASSFDTAEDVGDFVISTIFDIVSLVEDNKQHDELLDKLEDMNNKIDSIMEQGRLTNALLTTLLLEIEKSTYSNAIVDAEREINHCYGILKTLVESPNSQQSINNMKTCYSQMSHVQQIAEILSGQRVGINRESIFDILIREHGYCNGTELVGLQSYLKRLLMQGCAAVVSAEVLQYGNRSSQYQHDCKMAFQVTDTYVNSLFIRCAQDPCPTILKIMKFALQEAKSLNDAYAVLSGSFPWFYFLVIEMKRCNHECFQENIKSFGNQFFNLHTFPTKDKMFLVSYLDQQYSSNENGDPFGFELRQSCKIAFRNNLGVVINDVKGTETITVYMYINGDSVPFYANICHSGSTVCTGAPSSTGCCLIIVNYAEFTLIISFIFYTFLK